MRRSREELIDFGAWRTRQLFGHRRRARRGWLLAVGLAVLAALAITLLHGGTMPELISDATEPTVRQTLF